MSLEDSLSKLIRGDDASPVDVTMAMLDTNKIAMTANIKNVGVMNALKMYDAYFGDPETSNKVYSPKSALVMRTLYMANMLHSISKNGWRAEQIVKMLNGTLVFLGMNNTVSEGGGGILGNKKR